MDIGIGLPNTVPDTDGRTLIQWAKNAEEAGFSALGRTEASFRRVARFADGWIMGGGTPDMFAQGAAHL